MGATNVNQWLMKKSDKQLSIYQIISIQNPVEIEQL